MLSKSKIEKLQNLKPEEVSDKMRDELLNTWKVMEGEKAEKEFSEEYDEIFDEYDIVCNVSLNEFKEIAPEIYNRIGGCKGNKIFKAIKDGHFTVGLTEETNVKNKIEKIKTAPLLSEEVKKAQIEKRLIMFKEGQELKEKDVELTKSLAWKIWRIEEGHRTLEFINENKLEKNKLVLEYLGAGFVKKLKEIKFGDY